MVGGGTFIDGSVFGTCAGGLDWFVLVAFDEKEEGGKCLFLYFWSTLESNYGKSQKLVDQQNDFHAYFEGFSVEVKTVAQTT